MCTSLVCELGGKCRYEGRAAQGGVAIATEREAALILGPRTWVAISVGCISDRKVSQMSLPPAPYIIPRRP
jgi:hypothetical protein